MEIMDYVKPELLVVAFVLYFIETWLRKSVLVKNRFIPLINGAIGIAICSVYVISVCQCDSIKGLAAAAFTAFTQGVLVAGLSTYVRLLGKLKVQFKTSGNGKADQ